MSDTDTDTDTEANPYIDEFGVHVGYCNDCGEEVELHTECCEDGEVVAYDDDPDPQA